MSDPGTTGLSRCRSNHGSNLSEAVERDVQQLQIDARKQLAQSEGQEPGTTNKLTLVEARHQRCRQARYQRYMQVHELSREGQAQLAIAEKVGIGAETVSRLSAKFPRLNGPIPRGRELAYGTLSRSRGTS